MVTRATTSPDFRFFERALPTTAIHKKLYDPIFVHGRDIKYDLHTMIISNDMSRIIPNYTRTISFRDLNRTRTFIQIRVPHDLIKSNN
jgi:hypothetical protein